MTRPVKTLLPSSERIVWPSGNWVAEAPAGA